MVQEGSGTDQEAPLGVVLEGVGAARTRRRHRPDQSTASRRCKCKTTESPDITSDKRSATLRHSFPQVPVFGFRNYWESRYTSIRLDSN